MGFFLYIIFVEENCKTFVRCSSPACTNGYGKVVLIYVFLKKIDINYFTWATINISLTRVIIEMATSSLPNNKRKSV